jgi:acylglycerol lipase
VGYDFRGFGRSQGIKGLIDDFDLILEDSARFCNLIRKMYPHKAIFIGGHSLGGLVAYKLSLMPEFQKIFAGTLLYSPCLKLNSSHKNWLKYFAF